MFDLGLFSSASTSFCFFWAKFGLFLATLYEVEGPHAIFVSPTLLYSTILHFRAMNVPFQTETRASKRKLSSQSDLQNTYAFSQNSSLSISGRKRKKLSSFSQSQPTQLLLHESISKNPLSL